MKRKNDGAKIGVTAWPWSPRSKMGDFPAVRTYVDASWIFRPNGLYVEPFWQGATTEAPGLDTYLWNMVAEKQTDVQLCVVQDAPVWNKAFSRDDPWAWVELARYYFQLAARYGSKVHPNFELWLEHGPVSGSTWVPTDNNPDISGLSLLSAIEPGNEDDRWWKRGTDEEWKYLTAEEWAARMSAIYDGHCGMLGPVAGIKTADPNMTVVMPGLTEFNARYLLDIEAWCVKNRPDKKMPFDVVNVHHYSNTGNRLGVFPPTWNFGGGVPPEQDADFPGVYAIADIAKRLGLPFQVSEFGYDTQPPPDGSQNPESWQYIKPYGALSSERLQAEWLTRASLLYIAAGASVYVYAANDEPGYLSGGLWQSCGILAAASEHYYPKLAFHYLRQLSAELDGWKFHQRGQTDGVNWCEFVRPGITAVRLVYWLPTAWGDEQKKTLRGQPVNATELPKYIDIRPKKLSVKDWVKKVLTVKGEGE